MTALYRYRDYADGWIYTRDKSEIPNGVLYANLIPRTVPQLYLDCDGVLADFDTHALAVFGMPAREYEAKVGSSHFWAELEAEGNFYRTMPVMPDAHVLYEAVKHLNPIILTGCPRGNWAQQQKLDWNIEHFPDVPMITCRSADKRDYAMAGDIIIDDWEQHKNRWLEMGGRWITHTSAVESIAALEWLLQ